MAKYPERSDGVNDMMNANEQKIRELQARMERYQNAEILSPGAQEKLKTSIDLLDDIVRSRTLRNGTIRLLVDKILIHQVDKNNLDIHFKLNGPYQTHVYLWDQFEAMDRESCESEREQAMVEVVETLQRTTA